MAKAMKTKSTKGAKQPNRPMPTDPRELATAMFRQADHKMFGGAKTPLPKDTKKSAPVAG